jgi:hypothetical protein
MRRFLLDVFPFLASLCSIRILAVISPTKIPNIDPGQGLGLSIVNSRELKYPPEAVENMPVLLWVRHPHIVNLSRRSGRT